MPISFVEAMLNSMTFEEYKEIEAQMRQNGGIEGSCQCAEFGRLGSCANVQEHIWYQWTQQQQLGDWNQMLQQLVLRQGAISDNMIIWDNMGYAAPPKPKSEIPHATPRLDYGVNESDQLTVAVPVRKPDFKDMNSGAMSKGRSRGLRMAVYGTGSLTMVDIIMMGVFHSIFSFVFGFVCVGLFIYCYQKMNNEFKEAEVIYLEEYHALNAVPVEQVVALQRPSDEARLKALTS